MRVELTEIGRVLTRTSGFLETVTSHSLQPYRGCSFGRALCGVGCYVQHSWYVTQGRRWGEFLEARENAAESYEKHYAAERKWAQQKRGEFGIFLSSSTEPFLPQESRYRVTRRVLEAMLEMPPDVLVLQTHSHRVAEYVDIYPQLVERAGLRVHVSIETDREKIPGLPGHGSSVESRFEACRTLRKAGVPVVVTVSPLLPIAEPEAFFRRIAECADAVVIDHFIGGDGTKDGTRTRRTPLVRAMEALDDRSVSLAYRDAMVAVARQVLGQRVGVGPDGFAGRYEA